MNKLQKRVFQGLQAVAVAAWVVYSYRCATDPEPWGEIAQVANGLNLAALAFVGYHLVKFPLVQWAAREYARGYKAGQERSVATLHGRMKLAAELKAQGHEVRVLGHYQEDL